MDVKAGPQKKLTEVGLTLSSYGAEEYFYRYRTAKVTYKEVVESIKPEMSLEGKISRLWLSYFGHVM